VSERSEQDDELLRRVVEVTASELEEFCAVRRLEYANERDHLDPCCRVAVQRLVRELENPPALSPRDFGERHGWLGLGLVDVVFRWADPGPTFVELKCRALWPCVWDAVKLATAVLGGNAGAAYLVAGARASDWQKPIDGSQFFETGEWKTLGPDVRDRFLSSWRLWERQGHIPGRVPTGFSTVALGAFQLTIGHVLWEVRLARVDSAGEWTDWPRTATELKRSGQVVEAMERLVGESAELAPMNDDELERKLTRERAAHWTRRMEQVTNDESLSLRSRQRRLTELAEEATRDLGTEVFLPTRQFLETLAIRRSVEEGWLPEGARPVGELKCPHDTDGETG
jgi:hypothetical protein